MKRKIGDRWFMPNTNNHILTHYKVWQSLYVVLYVHLFLGSIIHIHQLILKLVFIKTCYDSFSMSTSSVETSLSISSRQQRPLLHVMLYWASLNIHACTHMHTHAHTRSHWPCVHSLTTVLFLSHARSELWTTARTSPSQLKSQTSELSLITNV